MQAVQRIARRGERVTFQKREVTVDAYKNHVSSWTDYFSCYAYVSTYQKAEDGDEVTYEERQVTFETRYCPELAEVTSIGYRILFRDEQYNIESVDAMNYQKKLLRFICRREKRQEASG